VDSYDTIISPRPYRAARRPNEALQALYGNAALTFGTELVEAFIRCLGSFLVGTLVELDHGKTAVVVGGPCRQRALAHCVVAAHARRRSR
jgi:HD-GYP domain-containing protein (c-di-GMP phosphodiesterase class II)